MVQKAEKRKKRGKLIKCTNPECKKTMDLTEQREIGNVVVEDGLTVLYCEHCGTTIIVK